MEKTKKETLSKEHYVVALQKNLKDQLDMTVSKATAWDLFRITMYTAYDLAKDKDLSLSGIGKFRTMISGRSGRKKMRVKASSRVDGILQAGGSFFTEVATTQAETKPVAPAIDPVL